jgi:hypothetical protein
MRIPSRNASLARVSFGDAGSGRQALDLRPALLLSTLALFVAPALTRALAPLSDATRAALPPAARAVLAVLLTLALVAQLTRCAPLHTHTHTRTHLLLAAHATLPPTRKTAAAPLHPKARRTPHGRRSRRAGARAGGRAGARRRPPARWPGLPFFVRSFRGCRSAVAMR